MNIWSECIKTLFYQTNKYFYLSGNKRWFCWIEIKILNELGKLNWNMWNKNVNCFENWMTIWMVASAAIFLFVRSFNWRTCGRTTHFTKWYHADEYKLTVFFFVCEQKSVPCQANWMNMLKYLNFPILFQEMVIPAVTIVYYNTTYKINMK